MSSRTAVAAFPRGARARAAGIVNQWPVTQRVLRCSTGPSVLGSAKRSITSAGQPQSGQEVSSRSMEERTAVDAAVFPAQGLSRRPVANSHTLQPTQAAAIAAVMPSDSATDASAVPRKP
jgi:hypothetical protein